ncbi:hypothetical protein D9619_007628 [Psilocybe cf. subviscida]|uniref:DUF6699 domain-containing protein n=1 Tax=Psilocybe cf. subviscida TaxID=2480587 RepID=A0A8H5ESH4_9AGAR|nr:hypothetical protein D9619_007628 [Psilocybe cf. subviscida]
MPGKHVHFSPFAAELDRVELPSPSFSVSTMPSSPGVLTPPPLGSGSPYESKQLPLIEADIHPWLSIHAAGSSFHNIDFAYPISHTPGTYNYIPPDVLRQPATVPPVSSMRITCGKLPWPITVESRSASFPFVTISDVFSTIYTSLRASVSGHEFNKLLPTKAAQDAVSVAFRARCERAGPTGYGSEKAKGLKSVDFLLGRTRFCGLIAVKMGLRGWVLEVS